MPGTKGHSIIIDEFSSTSEPYLRALLCARCRGLAREGLGGGHSLISVKTGRMKELGHAAGGSTAVGPQEATAATPPPSPPPLFQDKRNLASPSRRTSAGRGRPRGPVAGSVRSACRGARRPCLGAELGMRWLGRRQAGVGVGSGRLRLGARKPYANEAYCGFEVFLGYFRANMVF